MCGCRFESNGMASRSLGLFEKIANATGALYRHQAAQWPRRSSILRLVLRKELAPPKAAEWPAIKAEFSKVVGAIQSGAYRQLTVREGLVYAGVVLEISFWFFVGEMIGRRNVFGYLVSADYVSKDTKKRVAELKKIEERGY